MIESELFTVQKIQSEAEAYFETHGRGKGSGYKQYKIWEYQAIRNSDEGGHLIKQSTVVKELRQFNTDKKSRKAHQAKQVATWTELGPTIRNPTTSWNPGVGRVEAIAIDPNNYDHILIGSPTGGAWKTTTGGGTWTPLSDNEENMDILAVAIDPNNSSTYYIGTPVGAYKSTNGGATWNQIVSTGSWRKIMIHPNNSNIILAATSLGLRRSTDGGNNWATIESGNFKDIEFKPSSPSTIYACSGTVFVSTDDGATFTASSGTAGSQGRLAVTDANDNYVYFINSSAAVYRSTNSGVSFTQRSSGTTDVFGNLSWYGMGFGVSNTNADIVFAGGFELFKSTDGGTSFSLHVPWTWNNSSGLYIHADMHAIESAGPYIFTGTDGGISKGSNEGNQFDELSTGLGTRQFYRIGISKTTPGNVVAGAQDNGTAVLNDGTWYEFMGADGMEAFIDWSNSDNIIGTIQNGGVYRSTNGGQSQSNLGKPGGADGQWVTPVEQDPQDANTFYVANSGFYKRPLTGSGSWTLVSNLPGSARADEFKFAPSNSNIVYLAQGATLLKSTNKGISWTSVSGNGLSGNINYISIHPEDPNKVAVATGGSQKVYITTDGGTTWTGLLHNLPQIAAYCVVWANDGKNGLYVGTFSGVYFIDDNETEWVDYMESLPNVRVYELEIDYDNDKIYAGTYGRGLWVSDTYGNGITYQNDVKLLSTSNLISNELCGLDINPEITFKNRGVATLNSITINIYLNNVLIDTVLETNLSLANNDIHTLTLPSLQGVDGLNTIRITLTNPNGSSDENPVDNEKELNIELQEGDPHQFFIAAESTHPILNWEILNNGTVIRSKPGATAGTSNGNETYDFCLSEGCFDINVIDAFHNGTCDVPDWISTKVYWGGDIAAYNNKKYRAQWWTQGNIPSNGGVWTLVEDCSILVETNTYGLTDMLTGIDYFETELQNYTSPQSTNFCHGSAYSFDFNANNTNPTNCEPVIFTATETGGSGSSFSWNFGNNANPATATGIGPHTVEYLTKGEKTITLEVDGTTNSKQNYITVLQNNDITPEVSIALIEGDNPSCNADSHIFEATGTFTGDSPLYVWYVGLNEIQNGGSPTFTMTNFTDGDEIRVKLISNEACASYTEVTSSAITLISDVCLGSEEGVDNWLELYPNPIANHLTVNYSGIEPFLWTLHDATGRTLSTGASSKKLDLSTYQPGIYFFKYQIGETINVKEITKN